MIFKRILYPILALTFCVSTSNAQTPIIVELCELPSAVTETSGLENGPNDWFWTHNDSGNGPELFCVDTLGVIQRTVTVVGDPNTDWEEVTKDSQGNLFIGNFGNNQLNRTDLHVVKIPSIDTCITTAYVTDTINFSYPDQTTIPTVGAYGNFDMEALFYYQDSLHLFSKDRSDPSTGYTKHYTLPTVGGTYMASLKDSFNVESSSYIFSITAADISEDGSEVALLTSDKIWLFRNFTGTDFFGGDVAELTLSIFSQKEGICFRNGFLYVTDEASFGLGGKMYRLHPEIFVSVAEQTQEIGVKPVYNSSRLLQEIQLPTAGKYKWKLFSTNGKLLQKGSTSSSLNAREFKQKTGLYVIQFSSRESSKSLLIQL
jgi:hypothetical protein